MLIRYRYRYHKNTYCPCKQDEYENMWRERMLVYGIMLPSAATKKEAFQKKNVRWFFTSLLNFKRPHNQISINFVDSILFYHNMLILFRSHFLLPLFQWCISIFWYKRTMFFGGWCHKIWWLWYTSIHTIFKYSLLNGSVFFFASSLLYI